MVHSDTDQEVPMRVPRVLPLILAGAIAAIGPGANGAALQEPATKGQPLAADTPSTTVAGHTFIAPAGWTVSVKGQATIVEAPEGDSRIVFVDVAAKEPDAAIQEAWAAYGGREVAAQGRRPTHPDKDGWTNRRPTRTRRRRTRGGASAAGVRYGRPVDLVWIFDMADPVAEKRGAQVALIFRRLFPKGYSRETFAGGSQQPGRGADPELGAFIERGLAQLGVPERRSRSSRAARWCSPAGSA